MQYDVNARDHVQYDVNARDRVQYYVNAREPGCKGSRDYALSCACELTRRARLHDEAQFRAIVRKNN